MMFRKFDTYICFFYIFKKNLFMYLYISVLREVVSVTFENHYIDFILVSVLGNLRLNV